MSGPVIELAGVRFAWPGSPVPVLDVEALRIERGERVFVHGPSGSGKSTLLGLLAGVLVPMAGEVRVLGRDLGTLGGAGRDRFRADHVGYIFQLFNLIPYLSIVENVCLPCGFSASRRERAVRGGRTVREEALRLLAQLGMAGDGLVHRRATALSVGQQQRTAAARALMGSPELVIADEPTSALDAGRRKNFIDLLFEECANAGATLVFVSHDTSLKPSFDRSLALATLNGAAGQGAPA
jgi:putative ABC transport system ATP-binding protein